MSDVLKVPQSGHTGGDLLRERFAEMVRQYHETTIPQRSWDDDSEVILGSGAFRYRLVNDWAKLPVGWAFHDVAAVTVDSRDRVYVLNRGAHPLIVFDRDGNVVDHWGENLFSARPHGIHYGRDDTLYCTDEGAHAVFKCTLAGKVLLTLGMPGKPTPFFSGDPFCRCTAAALGPKNEIYVSDGYFNARVHKYSPDGKLLLSWGSPGSDRGEFNVPHNICVDLEGWVYVADRENLRVQVFDENGKYETQWNNVSRASALDRSSVDGLFYVGELGPDLRANFHVPNLGPRVSILTARGEVLVRLGQLPPGDAPDRFLAPHGIAIDSHGDIYVGEVSYSNWRQSFPGVQRPEYLRSLRKLVKLPRV